MNDKMHMSFAGSDVLGAWIENDNTVPQDVLDNLPDDERNRVMRAMTAAGVVAA